MKRKIFQTVLLVCTLVFGFWFFTEMKHDRDKQIWYEGEIDISPDTALYLTTEYNNGDFEICSIGDTDKVVCLEYYFHTPDNIEYLDTRSHPNKSFIDTIYVLAYMGLGILGSGFLASIWILDKLMQKQTATD